MTDKRSSKTSKFKNFLATGSVEGKEEDRDEFADEYQIQEDEYQEEPQEEAVVEDIVETEIPSATAPEPDAGPAGGDIPVGTTPIEKGIAELKEMISRMSSEMGGYATTKEQLKEYSAVMSRRDAEIANRKLVGMLEQLSAMREDFFKLCGGINAKLDGFSPKDVLRSFEAFGVDMENILVDCGVEIGPGKSERLNTTQQRIVDVIPTDDQSKNAMIAERVSDGYVYQGRILQKEKVKIYKFSGNEKTEGDEEK